LHQLRGRVGRGSEVSYCLLMSDAETETASARLNAMVDTTDSFAIAEMDLQLRGPGQFFGTRQHGPPGERNGDVAALSRPLDCAEINRDMGLRPMREVSANRPFLTSQAISTGRRPVSRQRVEIEPDAASFRI
jgi:RecG-like helicase